MPHGQDGDFADGVPHFPGIEWTDRCISSGFFFLNISFPQLQVAARISLISSREEALGEDWRRPSRAGISLNSMDPTNLYDMFNGLLRDSGFGVSNNFNIF